MGGVGGSAGIEGECGRKEAAGKDEVARRGIAERNKVWGKCPKVWEGA